MKTLTRDPRNREAGMAMRSKNAKGGREGGRKMAQNREHLHRSEIAVERNGETKGVTRTRMRIDVLESAGMNATVRNKTRAQGKGYTEDIGAEDADQTRDHRQDHGHGIIRKSISTGIGHVLVTMLERNPGREVPHRLVLKTPESVSGALLQLHLTRILLSRLWDPFHLQSRLYKLAAEALKKPTAWA